MWWSIYVGYGGARRPFSCIFFSVNHYYWGKESLESTRANGDKDTNHIFVTRLLRKPSLFSFQYLLVVHQFTSGLSRGRAFST